MPVKKAFGAHRSDEYNGSVQYDPLKALEDNSLIHMGVMESPREHILFTHPLH